MTAILIADAVSPLCAERLSAAPGFTVQERPGMSREELLDAVAETEGLVVRSATRVDAEVLAAAPRLRAVGRAGEGVDNIDVEAATERGVVVMNTPGGNTISAAEHTLALMMALARNVPEGHRTLSEGLWERSRLIGVELYGKTLGILGLGKIGREVAARAGAFGMKILGHDPFLAEEQGRHLKFDLVDLDGLLSGSDFLTVHTPLTDATRNIIGAAELARARPGIRLINCARGGILDEQAVADAVRAGTVAGAAFDVFTSEPPEGNPLLGVPGILCTPHLGASTREAQEKVAVRIADQMVEFLSHGTPLHALNVESVDPGLRPRLQPYQDLAERLGRLQAHLLDSPLREIRVEYFGDVQELPTGPLTAAVLKGYLENVLSEPVNQVNARVLARRVGIGVAEVQSGDHGDFANLITTTFHAADGSRTVAGTLFDHNRPRIVRLDDYHMEVVARGEIFLYSNDDRPGIVGQVGTLLGEAGINIAQMALGRDRTGGTALGVLNTDSRVPDDLAERVEQVSGILWTRRLAL